MYFNEKFDLSAFEMHRLGVFNPIVEHDNELFVDPKLLENVKYEFADARAALDSYFGDTVDLLRLSEKKDDLSWNAACKRMQCKEKASAGIGYSKNGRSGNGIGKVLARRIVVRAAEILPLVEYKASVFELIGVFATGLGCDRLSDMIVSILAPSFYAYTARVAEQLGIHQLKIVKVGGVDYACPCFSDEVGPILLLPKAILKPLPIAADIGEALENADLNEETRDQLNSMFAAAAKKGKILGKAQLQDFIFSRPKIYQEILAGYEAAKSEPYDFDKDSRNISDTKALAKEIVGKAAIEIEGLSKVERVEALLTKTLSDFRKLVTENRLSDLLFNDDGSPRKEIMSQRLIYAVADIYGRLFDVDVNREGNAGSGAVDFKFSIGQGARLLIEVKLSTHKRLTDAYYFQLPAYAKSEGIKRLVLLIIQVDDSTSQIEKLKEAIKADEANTIQVEVIDARRKPSASKLQE